MAKVDLVVGDHVEAVPRARGAVAQALRDCPGVPADELALVVTELVTNAVLHGTGPVRLRCDLLDPGPGVHVEVEDRGRDLPVLPRQSTEAMTGRGLALVGRLSSRWGVDPAAGGGKVVWAELTGEDTEPDEGAPAGPVDLDALLAAFPDDGEQVFTVELGSVPTELLLEAKSHLDNVVREAVLAAGADDAEDEDEPGGGRVSSDLSALVTAAVHGFAAARSAIKRQALAAAQRGSREVRLTLTLPASAADAGEQYLAALDEVDRYARNARLLTLETPPVHKVFRRWYVQTLVDELRRAAAGLPDRPTPTFPERLAEALTRLAPLETQATQLEVLQRVTAELTGAGTVEDIARIVVLSCTQALGAHSAHVHLLDDDGLWAAAASGVRDARRAALYDRVPVSEDLPVGAALLSRAPVVVRDKADLARRFPALVGAYPWELSLLAAPLTIGQHQLGVLSLTFSGSARVEERTQLAFLTTLADVTAQALERATAASAAAAAAEQLQFLAEASVVLSGTLDARDVLAEVARLVVPRIADWCSIELVDDGHRQTVALAHVDPAKVEWARQLGERYPADPDAPTGVPAVLRTGVTEVYTDITDEMLVGSSVDAEHLRLIRELGMSSVLIVPLNGRTGTLGAVTMISAESGRRYDDSDVAFAEDLARRAALAVENAQAFREQSGRLDVVRRIAEAAQHAILATPPPRIGPVGLAARYQSAAAEALIGGDLYEVVARPGAVRLLIGDVRGKGLDAVRTATVVLGEFRAAAADLSELTAVAAQLDRRLRGYLDAEDFVTALLAEVRDDGSYALACCGHPAPLLVSGGAVRAAHVEPSLPLGLGSAPGLTTGRLAPGDRLVLHTDGILEARDPQHRFVDVLRLVEPLLTGELEPALDEVLRRLRDAVSGDLGDDLALLVAEYRPAG